MPLDDDELHGGITDDALEAAAQAQFAAAITDEPEPTTDDEPASPASGLPTDAGEAPSGDDDNVWTFGDGDDALRITREQAQAYAEFEAFLAANPELSQAIAGTVTGTHKFVPAETPAPEASAAGTTPTTDWSTPPDALDMDDPVQKAVWDRMVETRQMLDAAQAELQQHRAVIQSQSDQSAASVVNRAVSSFQEANKLTDEDMTEIQQVAARLNVVPSLMNPVDPITGLPRQVDPLKALESAFDLARWQIPRLREQELAQVQAETRQNNNRKAKLSSLGGSSGSVPRQQNQVPSNPTERRQAMLSEMAQMLQGNWINPEDS